MSVATLRKTHRWPFAIALAALVAVAALVDHFIGGRLVITSVAAAGAFALGLVSAGRRRADDESARHEAMMARLRDSDRHKEELLATLAHELRNPLAPIRS